MAHFAQLDDDNKVIQVIVVADRDTRDPATGEEKEEFGISFCKGLLGGGTRWKQTSYNGRIRKNYAGIGYTFDPFRDAFIPPKPYNSWLLDETTCHWGPPVPMPEDAGIGEGKKMYRWDEDTVNWVEVVPEPAPQ